MHLKTEWSPLRWRLGGINAYVILHGKNNNNKRKPYRRQSSTINDKTEKIHATYVIGQRLIYNELPKIEKKKAKQPQRRKKKMGKTYE